LNPDTKTPLLVIAACPIENRRADTSRLTGILSIKVIPNSLAYHVYKKANIKEPFNCNYELNPLYSRILESHGLVISGKSLNGAARIIELPEHRFFMGVGFLPQLNSEEKRPHPLLVAFLKAAI
jgi:CTP synthase